MPAEIGDQTALRRGVVYLVTYVNRAKSLELHRSHRPQLGLAASSQCVNSHLGRGGGKILSLKSDEFSENQYI